MAKSYDQKVKLLYLMDVFLKKTDSLHPMSAADLIAYLAEYGITVERKTIYGDIEVLKSFGMDIQNRRRQPSGYYLASRDFEPGELKMLMDAVQSSKFITQKRSRELIRKLAGLTSIYEAKNLEKHIPLESYVKTQNEDVFENINQIHQAMSSDSQISFMYFEWSFDKDMQSRKKYDCCTVSPWELIWKDEDYYLIALDERSSIVKHYRVDKMTDLSVLNKKRKGGALFEGIDNGTFASQIFAMFGSREESVRIEFENRLLDAVMDRFGEGITIHKSDEEHFSVFVRVNVSSQFFGWISGFGKGARILAPENVKKDYVRFLKRALGNYTRHCD